jgi:hypothetical protein
MAPSADYSGGVGSAQHEHVARVPRAFLGVHVVDMVPPASQVNVEPVTEDDWELIQLHAGLMESEFLRQVRGCLGVTTWLLHLQVLMLGCE